LAFLPNAQLSREASSRCRLVRYTLSRHRPLLLEAEHVAEQIGFAIVS
jgi:hypothetical protein